MCGGVGDVLVGVTEYRWCLDALHAERRGVCNSQQCSEISSVQQPAQCVPAGGWPLPSGTSPEMRHHLSNQTVDPRTPERTHTSAKTRLETLNVWVGVPPGQSVKVVLLHLVGQIPENQFSLN